MSDQGQRVLIGFRADQDVLDALDQEVLDRRIAEGPKSKFNRALLLRELVEDGLRRLQKADKRSAGAAPKGSPRDTVRTRSRTRREAAP